MIDFGMSTYPCPPFLSSLNRCALPAIWKKPGSEIACVGVRLPDVSAESARKGLIVEPGGYAPRSGRFNSGLSGESLSASQLAGSMPSTNRFGSNQIGRAHV